MSALLTAFGLGASLALASTQGGIPRQPDVSGDTIVNKVRWGG